MNKTSPTNLIADIRAAFAVILLGYVLLHLFTDKEFDAEKTGLIVMAVWGIANQVLGSVLARYTADATATTPELKTNAAAVLLLCACLAVGTCLSACAGSQADTDFRRKVSDVQVGGTGGAAADGSVTAGANVKMTLRDPDTSK